MSAIPSMGVLAKLGMKADTTSTPATADEAYEFLNENLAMSRGLIRTDGLRGTRLHPKERVRSGLKAFGGPIEMEPTYAELVALLPRIVAAASAQSGFNTYTVSDTVPVAFQIVVDRVAKVFTYLGCKVSKATFRSGTGQNLKLTLEIEALDHSIGNAGTFPVLTISATPPFVFSDAVLTLGGTTYQMMEWECTIDWHLKTDRYINSTTRTDLPSMDLSIEFKATLPYTSDTVGLYDAGGSDSVAGITGNVNFTYGGAGGGASGVNLKFDFANLIFPADKNPSVPSKDEVLLVLNGEARRSGTTSPLIVTLDSTT